MQAAEAPAPQPTRVHFGAPVKEPSGYLSERSFLSKAPRKPRTSGDGPKVRPLNISVTRVHLLKLTEIDQVAQRFKAEWMIEFVIPHGSHDKELMNDRIDDVSGKARWDGPKSGVPCARWYLEQIDFPNSVEHTVLESKFFNDQEDIKKLVRVEGWFAESFELQYFPWDFQELSMQVAFNCSLQGSVPVILTLVQEPEASVDFSRFVFHNVWRLSPILKLQPCLVGACNIRGERKKDFPALQATAMVQRRAEYFAYNMFLPLFAFLLMSLTSFSLPVTDISARLSVCLTLVLTAAAFKFAVATLSPHISYSTVLDSYVLFIMAFVFLTLTLTLPCSTRTC